MLQNGARVFLRIAAAIKADAKGKQGPFPDGIKGDGFYKESDGPVQTAASALCLLFVGHLDEQPGENVADVEHIVFHHEPARSDRAGAKAVHRQQGGDGAVPVSAM